MTASIGQTTCLSQPRWTDWEEVKKLFRAYEGQDYSRSELKRNFLTIATNLATEVEEMVTDEMLAEMKMKELLGLRLSPLSNLFDLIEDFMRTEHRPMRKHFPTIADRRLPL